MGILDIFRNKQVKPEARSGWDFVQASRSLNSFSASTGVNVTPHMALTASAVYACTRVLSETVASLPLPVYKTLSIGKEKAYTHSLYSVLHDAPNPEITSFEFRETMMLHLCLWGNAYAEIVRDSIGVKELWILPPNHVHILRTPDNWLAYAYEDNSIKLMFPQENILHIRGLSSDGVVGLSPIAQARNAIGLALATEEFGSRFFANGARPGAILEHPGKLTQEAYERLKNSWETRHTGLENAHRIAILEEGMKIEEIGIPPEDAQFLQTRTFQLEEIARIYRVPLHLIGDLSHATFSNIEHQSIDFVVHTIRPWLVRWEQAIKKSLFTQSETEYFAEFQVDGLLRGDIQSRYQAYSIGRQNGWLSANDVRGLENLNPIPNGDMYLVPLNMVPSDTVDQQVPVQQRSLDVEKRSTWINDRKRLMISYRKIYQDAATRIIKRETQDIKSGARKYIGKRSQADFNRWLDDFYAEHTEYIKRQMLPVVASYGEMVAYNVADEVGKTIDIEKQNNFIQSYVDEYAKRHVIKSKEKLQKRISTPTGSEADLLDDIDAEMDDWNTSRPESIAISESSRAQNAIASLIYGAVGITALRWFSNGSKACPYCQEMDGRTVEIHTNFFTAGDDYNGMAISHSIGHPPLHDGCECIIGAG